MKNKNNKLGHQAPKGFIVDLFSSIMIDGDFAYCKSHNFIYNTRLEEEKLYNAQPCFFTDSRYIPGFHNYYGNTYLYWNRKKEISLKSCIRKTLNTRNIPIGTIVKFGKDWYYPKHKKVDLSYRFKIKRENNFDPDYKIDLPEYSNNFTNCEFSQRLTEELRKNGFIVSVKKNTSFLTNMINSAIAATGKTNFADSSISGEIAVAYGFGKIVGFSSKSEDFMGYSNGINSVLWDKFGEFNKWSRCYEIPKTEQIDQILNTLKQTNHEH